LIKSSKPKEKPTMSKDDSSGEDSDDYESETEMEVVAETSESW
jgi:hypothetical protein